MRGSPATASCTRRCSWRSRGRWDWAGPAAARRSATCFRSRSAAWVKERDGEPIRNPRAFLRQVIVNQRKMQLRSQRRHPASSFDELAAAVESTDARTAEAIGDHRPPIGEQVERRELVELVLGILATIERRASTVWTMRYLCGYTPERVIGALGITHRQYARLLERATVAIDRKLAAYVAGDWCPGYAPKLVRLAAGRASAAEAQEARAHLASCPSCRGSYETFTRLHRSPAQPVRCDDAHEPL